jgi:predicted DNA-binding ribbon-helix-helix protein
MYFSEGSGILPRYDALGFRIPPESSESQYKYLLLQPDDPQEFLRIKREETGWTKLHQAFNQGKCTLNQLRSEIHHLRNSVINYGIPLSVRAQAYLLLCNITDAQVQSRQELYNTLVGKFRDLPPKNRLRRDIHQVGLHCGKKSQ